MAAPFFVLTSLGACGSGTPADAPPPCKALPPPEGPDAAGTLQDDQNGGTWCLQDGQVLTVYLHAPTPDQAARWEPIRNDSPKVLDAVGSGAQTLVMGVTAGVFDAVGKGTAELTSKRPDGATWKATIVVR